MGQRRPPCPLVSPAALLLSGQKKTSRPTFLRHLTYMDIKVAASGLSDQPTWSRNLFEFVFAIQLENFLCTFNSCITPVVIIKVVTAISLAASTDLNHFWSRNKVRPERIYNPITTIGFSAMFTFQLDNTKG